MDEKKEEIVCAFTGHRRLGEDFNSEDLFALIKDLIAQGARTFLNGMAIGFDLLAAEFVMAEKELHPDVKFVACVPCETQTKYYSYEDRMRYRTVMMFADEVITLSKNYTRACMLQRDRYMAERANTLITYCRKEEGGTAYTVKYFKKVHPEGKIYYL